MAAAPQTVPEFIALLAQGGFLTVAEVEAHIRKQAMVPATPGELAGLLVRDGLLSPFQAENIQQGKWRGFVLGRYQVLEPIGSGGMGLVYLCRHQHMKRLAAIKVLPAEKAKDPSSLERFFREARAAASLDHPHLVRAYDIGHDQNLHFLVMEYVDGVSLQAVVKRGGPMSPDRAAHCIRQAALGLQHAFASGLIHRDIKPANLVVDRQGTVKVLDMGLARFFDDEADDLTRKFDEKVLGTADYLAPEQAIDSHTVDIRADVYSLGATMYFLLTGDTPFEGNTTAQKLLYHQWKAPTPIRQKRPNVPAGLASVVEKMMAKKPADRYATPEKVALALAPWTRGPIPLPSESEMPRPCPAVARLLAADVPPGGDPVATPPPMARIVTEARPARPTLAAAWKSLLDRLGERRRRAAALAVGVLCLVLMLLLIYGLSGTLPVPVVPSSSAKATGARSGGLLRGDAAAPPAQVDLSAEGKLDWIHWGRDGPAGVQRKKSVPQLLGGLTAVGEAPIRSYDENPTAFRWSDGTPLGGTADVRHGVYNEPAGNGLIFWVPAEPTPRVLRVYVAVYKSQAAFDASLSDGSAPPFSAVLENREAATLAVYTVRFKAASPGQRLMVRFVMKDGNATGNVALQAATLAAE